MQVILASGATIAGLGIIGIILVAPEPVNFSYYAGLILVFMFNVITLLELVLVLTFLFAHSINASNSISYRHCIPSRTLPFDVINPTIIKLDQSD